MKTSTTPTRVTPAAADLRTETEQIGDWETGLLTDPYHWNTPAGEVIWHDDLLWLPQLVRFLASNDRPEEPPPGYIPRILRKQTRVRLDAEHRGVYHWEEEEEIRRDEAADQHSGEGWTSTGLTPLGRWQVWVNPAYPGVEVRLRQVDPKVFRVYHRNLKWYAPGQYDVLDEACRAAEHVDWSQAPRRRNPWHN